MTRMVLNKFSRLISKIKITWQIPYFNNIPVNVALNYSIPICIIPLEIIYSSIIDKLTVFFKQINYNHKCSKFLDDLNMS